MFLLIASIILGHVIQYFYLPPAAEGGRGWEIIKCLLYVRASVRPSICHVFTYTLISHSFINISPPNLQGMLMAMKTCLCKSLASTKWPPCHLFENHKDALNLEILQLASSNLHKRHMARKTSLIVILA